MAASDVIANMSTSRSEAAAPEAALETLMAANAKPRAKVPKTAAVGEVITIKTLIRHRMESGHRPDENGGFFPREIINSFTADFNGDTVFATELHTAVAANPSFEFSVRVQESGTFTFTWIDDVGEVYTLEESIEVS